MRVFMIFVLFLSLREAQGAPRLVRGNTQDPCKEMLEYAKDISAPVGYQLSLRVKCVLAKGVQQDSNSVATLCEEWTTVSWLIHGIPQYFAL
jgi:hypothetical protein